MTMRLMDLRGCATVAAPSEWSERPDESRSDAAPYTLTRDNGFGALQFSFGLYESGAIPDPSPDDLLNMLNEFGRSRELGRAMDQFVEKSDLRLAGGTFRSDGDFIRVWYVSDGANVALVTYLCSEGEEDEETQTCEQIVRSLRFTS